MDLFTNVGFIKLLIIITISVVPGVAGLYLLIADDEVKRSIRRAVCRTLFDSTNVFTHRGFVRFLNIVGLLLILISLTLSWFLLLRQHFG